jgi:molybdopterin-containing oxidoreductase family iron-sulfur binding subunit
MSQVKVEFHQADLSKRKLLKAASLGGAALAVAPGIKLFQAAHAKPDGQPVTDKNRWGLLIDVNRCADGCNDCVDACQTENGWGNGSTDEQKSRDDQKAQWIRKVSVKDPQTKREFNMPVMCQHCENPPCQDVCPTGASFQREDGISMVDRHICIGCRYCMMACPYKARSFVHEALSDQRAHQPRGKGCVESCTLCAHRVDKGKIPACVESCQHGAMLFGDLNDPQSPISKKLASIPSRQLREDLKLNTGVRYTGI